VEEQEGEGRSSSRKVSSTLPSRMKGSTYTPFEDLKRGRRHGTVSFIVASSLIAPTRRRESTNGRIWRRVVLLCESSILRVPVDDSRLRFGNGERLPTKDSRELERSARGCRKHSSIWRGKGGREKRGKEGRTKMMGVEVQIERSVSLASNVEEKRCRNYQTQTLSTSKQDS